MQFQLPINIKPLEPSIKYTDKILLIGSCFTEHIGNYLSDVKFNVLQNPNGILFDTLSVCRSITSYIEGRRYTEDELFYLNEAWHSWQHHGRFSHPDKNVMLQNINASKEYAHAFLKDANWLIITLGSAFVYKLVGDAPLSAGRGVGSEAVANCHKAPAQTFTKQLTTIEENIVALDSMLYRLLQFNPKLNVMFTISPVRHIRDGVVENNRNKARLIEAVHHVVNKLDKLHYFPAYELVIDVLRDYRFYDIDLVHPNYPATQFVMEKFTETCFDDATRLLIEDIRKIVIAKNHKPFNVLSQQHKQFLALQLKKVKQLQQQYTYLDFSKELEYFANGI